MSNTDTERLEEIRLAIDSLISGRTASYGVNGRQVTRLNLKELYEIESNMVARIAAATGGTTFSVAVIGSTG